MSVINIYSLALIAYQQKIGLAVMARFTKA